MRGNRGGALRAHLPVGSQAIERKSNGSGQRELGQAVVAHLFHEISYAAQVVKLVNCPLDGTHPFPSEHESSQLTKLPSHLRFLIGPLIIAAGTLAQADALATIFQDESDTRWLELRSHGRELCILSDVHPAAERGNDGIVYHCLSKGA